MANKRTLIEQQLTTGLILLGRHYSRQLDKVVDDVGLSGASSVPLAILSRMGDGTRQVSLAHALGVEGPALVRQLDRLCALGLVERVEDAADRRAKKLYLTVEGRKVASKVEASFAGLRHILLADISNDDIEATLRIFKMFKLRMNSPSDLDEPEG
ncbi:Transcriptional regulator SlyA [compost metagenome]|jgi:MarR family transcriptional regulator for hemolysin